MKKIVIVPANTRDDCDMLCLKVIYLDKVYKNTSEFNFDLSRRNAHLLNLLEVQFGARNTLLKINNNI